MASEDVLIVGILGRNFLQIAASEVELIGILVGTYFQMPGMHMFVLKIGHSV